MLARLYDYRSGNVGWAIPIYVVLTGLYQYRISNIGWDVPI